MAIWRINFRKIGDGFCTGVVGRCLSIVHQNRKGRGTHWTRSADDLRYNRGRICTIFHINRDSKKIFISKETRSGRSCTLFDCHNPGSDALSLLSKISYIPSIPKSRFPKPCSVSTRIDIGLHIINSRRDSLLRGPIPNSCCNIVSGR